VSLIDPAFEESWEQDRDCASCGKVTLHTVGGMRYGRKLVNVVAECQDCETTHDVDWDDENFQEPY
jgi:hypothetical protein